MCAFTLSKDFCEDETTLLQFDKIVNSSGHRKQNRNPHRDPRPYPHYSKIKRFGFRYISKAKFQPKIIKTTTASISSTLSSAVKGTQEADYFLAPSPVFKTIKSQALHIFSILWCCPRPISPL